MLRTRGHEVDQLSEKRFSFVFSIESLGLILTKIPGIGF